MLCYRGHAASYGEVWYDEQPPAGHRADIVIYRQQRAPRADGRCTSFLSLISDLTPSEDAILKAFEGKCRADVRRADSRDGLLWEQADAHAALVQFCDLYDRFADHKRIEPADRQWLRSACDGGRLIITRALHGSNCLMWHVYLRCGQTAWLMHSVSQPESADRALVGRANRWLHWRDMIALKGMGMTHYDWGGLFEDESPPGHSGVNRFKRSFGGKPMRYFDCTVGVTLRGRLYLPLRDAWRRHVNPSRARAKARDQAWQPS